MNAQASEPIEFRRFLIQDQTLMLISVPGIKTNEVGFAALARLNEQLDVVAGTAIQLDFSYCSWLDANMTAPLGGIIVKAANRKNVIYFQNFGPKVRNILARNGFIQPPLPDPNETAIPYRQFEIDEAKLFAEYTDQHLRGKGMPKMSVGLRSAFLLALDEIFQNASVHSKTKFGVFCCGQFFPKREQLIFDIADMGIGFQKNILERTGKNLSSDDAIEWALTGSNTTRELDIPGGMGLKLIREFIEMNGGQLIIVSDFGYVNLTGGGLKKKKLSSPYPGTVLSLTINTADSNSYYLAGEDPNTL